MILAHSEYTFKIEYKRGQDNIIGDAHWRFPFASAQNSDKSNALDKLSSGASFPEPSLPWPNSPDESYNVFVTFTLISKQKKSDEDVSDSKNLDHDFEQLEYESDSNVKVFD